MVTSEVVCRERVAFPEFRGERVYMREFTRAGGLPNDLARWQQTVDQMLVGIDADGPIFLMVDQRVVPAAGLHRRGGAHVDGCWNPALYAHGHGGGGGHVTSGRETLVLASTDLGCRALVGPWDGMIGSGGDCSHVDRAQLRAVELSPGYAWTGDALTMLHESIPVSRSCERTVVRLNVRHDH